MENLVFSDSLKAKLAEAETLEDVVKVCAKEGLEVTLEQLQAAEATQKDEFDEDDLDNVAGGLSLLGPIIGVGIYALWQAIRNR